MTASASLAQQAPAASSSATKLQGLDSLADQPIRNYLSEFKINKKGDIDRVSATLEPSLGEDIVFTRGPEKIATEVLQGLTRDYVLNGQVVNVALIGGILRLTVPGQPQYELVPTKGLAFDVKGLPGFSVEFQKDASVKISEAVFNQPNGVFRARKSGAGTCRR
jgi:hypothetical protein